MMRGSFRQVVMIPAALLVARCAGDGDVSLGQVTAAITSVPSGVQCIRLSLRIGAATSLTHRNFVVAAGQSAALDLGVIAPGELSVTPNAYTQACGSVANATVPTWVGEPVSATIRAGEATTLALSLRPRVGASATVDFVQPVRDIAASHTFQRVFAVMADGTVRRWGQGTTVFGAVEVVPGLTEVVQVASGGATCALRRDGTAWCWGANDGAAVGDGTDISRPTPVPVVMPPGVTFRSIAMYQARTCALAASGNTPIYCWGRAYGVDGTLGLGTSDIVRVPTSYGNIVFGWPFENLALGNDTLCYGSGASLTCRGTNTNGWWGAGAGGSSSAFAPTISLSFGQNHLCGVFANGATRCAGSNNLGQLGNGTTTASNIPVDVQIGGEARQVASGRNHSCALRVDGRVFCWGDGTQGQLGDRDAAYRYSPVEVYGLTGVVRITATWYGACALKSDGTVWCWGDNDSGEIGDGTRFARFAPTRVGI